MANTIQHKRGTEAEWTAADPTLAAGQVGVETDTGKFKIGNGSAAWSALGYFAPAAAAVFSPALAFTLDNPNAYGTSADDQFSYSVAISENYAIVSGRFEDDAGGTSSGKAYIFNVTTGALLHTLDNPNPYGTSADDNFGSSVAISDDYAIVGAYNEDEAGGTNSGKAYIFNLASTTNLTTENFVGIADAAYASGATATIQTAGAVDDAQSGLTAGQAYFVQVDGTLDTTPDTLRVFAGVALSATELMIGKDMSSTAVVPYTDSDVATYLSGNGYDTATNIISTITDSAPATLDTLNELAAALGDDANFASTVTSSLALKADTSSLSTVATTGAYSDLTGTPTLATVATSGSYNDLTGTPTLATVATSGSYNDLTDQPVIAAGYTNSDVDTHLNTSTATTDQILKWTGSDYSWVADSGGATEDAFYENSQTLGANVTISAGRNAMTTGPLTVGTGFSVTIESGCRVVII